MICETFRNKLFVDLQRGVQLIFNCRRMEKGDSIDFPPHHQKKKIIVVMIDGVHVNTQTTVKGIKTYICCEMVVYA